MNISYSSGRQPVQSSRGWQWRAGLAFMAAALVASAALTAGPASATDLDSIEASFRSQQDALAERQLLELARLDSYWDQKISEREAEAAAEQADLQRRLDAAVAPVLAQRDDRLADVEARRQSALELVDEVYRTKRAEKEAWVAEHSSDLAADAKPLSDDAAKIVEAEMKEARKAEEEPIKVAEKDTIDPLKEQYKAVKDHAETDRKALEADQKTSAAELAESYERLVAATETESEDRLADLEDEADKLEFDYKSTKDELTTRSKVEIDEAKDAGEDTGAMSEAWKARLTELKALYEEQSNDLEEQFDTTKTATKAQLSALKADNDAQAKYQDEVDDARLDNFDADTDELLLSLTIVIKETEAAFKVQLDDLKAIYEVKEAVAVSETDAFRSALEGIVDLVDKQHADARKSVEDNAKNEHDIIDVQTETEIVLVEAPFQRRLNDSRVSLESDIVNLKADHDNARSALERRHLREELLASTDYQILRTRTKKYLDSAAGATVPLDNFYDPTSDIGSMFNVAKTIGADHTALTGAGVKVALLDTGVAPVNGLAQANVVLGPDFSFEDLDDDLRGIDTNGHGTHLAGIIVGSDDAWLAGDQTRTESRSLGIAPDAELVAVKAATATGATDVSQVIAGINWIIRYNQENPTSPIRVLNLAYGTNSEQDYSIDPLSYAVERAWKAGVVVVVAAGNEGWDSSHLTNPGRNPYVIAVGASQAAGNKTVVAGYSSEGSPDRGVDLVAPGRSIVSLRNPGSFSDTVNGQGRVGDRLVRGSGTSQATAVVSGAVALLLEDRPSLTPDQVKTLLMATADPIADGDPRANGAGVLDIGKALDTDTIYSSPQAWTPSDGSGSLEAARGSSHIPLDDGTLLFGDTDVFGNTYADDGWATDEWTGRTWRAAGWRGRTWRSDSWEGRSWRGDSWYGRSWRDDGWVGRSWRAEDWEGRTWRADRWEGRTWRSDAWEGRSWRAEDWEGRTWRGFGCF